MHKAIMKLNEIKPMANSHLIKRICLSIINAFLLTIIMIWLSGCAMMPHPDSEALSGSAVERQLTGSMVQFKNAEAELSGMLQVHYIDVGQGASQLLIGPTGMVMLIDAGNNDKEELMVAYLKEQGIRKIDILIGTHPDADHIGGLDAVIDHFDVDKIYMPKVQANTKTFEDVLRAVQHKGLKIGTAKAGIDLVWEPGVDVKMIAPINEYKDTNEMSAVMHLVYDQTSFLFTGDAESRSERDLLDSGISLQADVLLIGHHGSNTSTSKQFLDKVNPSYGVIQVGRNNYGHPAEEILNRLADKGIDIFRNDEQGHIIFISDGKEISVEQNPWKYVHTEAGDLVVTATVDNDSPTQNSSVAVTLKATDSNGHPIPDADVHLKLHYKSTKTEYEGKTDGSGVATLSFKIGRAMKDFKVDGDLTVTYGDRLNHSQISFTPQ